MTTIEQTVLELIQRNSGIKRIHLHSLIRQIPMDLDLFTLKMILAELLAQGKIMEIEFTWDGIKEFIYIPGPVEIKVRGTGI